MLSDEQGEVLEPNFFYRSHEGHSIAFCFRRPFAFRY